MSISIRPASATDERFIALLGARTAHLTTPAMRSVAAATAASAFERLRHFCARQPGTLTLVAEDDGRHAGFLILLTDIPDDASAQPQGFVAFMAVEAAHRRRGVGAALLAAAQRESALRGLAALSLMVACDNAPARALYDAAGLVPERLQMTKRLHGPPA